MHFVHILQIILASAVSLTWHSASCFTASTVKWQSALYVLQPEATTQLPSPIVDTSCLFTDEITQQEVQMS